MGTVKQLSVLSELFARALEICVPDSVAVPGIAGDNGLERVNHLSLVARNGHLSVVSQVPERATSEA
jgi:hypothetical protein